METHSDHAGDHLSASGGWLLNLNVFFLMTYSVWWITVISDAEICLAYTQCFNPTVFWEREPIIATAEEDHCACGWGVTTLPYFEELDLSRFALGQRKASAIPQFGMVLCYLDARMVGHLKCCAASLEGANFSYDWRTEIFLALPLPKSIGGWSELFFLFKNSMDLKGPFLGRAVVIFVNFFTYSYEGVALNVFPQFWAI